MLVEVSTHGEPTTGWPPSPGQPAPGGNPTGGGASSTLLGPAFRVLARLGMFRWFVDRQRVVTTFVTNLRGPRSQVKFLGATVTDITPVTSITGNVTISFAALSYAGTLPRHCDHRPRALPRPAPDRRRTTEPTQRSDSCR